MRHAAFALLIVLVVAGCREREDPVPDPKAATAAAPAPTALDAIVQPPLEKARAVEQDVLESAERTDAALDAAEGG